MIVKNSPKQHDYFPNQFRAVHYLGWNKRKKAKRIKPKGDGCGVVSQTKITQSLLQRKGCVSLNYKNHSPGVHKSKSPLDLRCNTMNLVSSNFSSCTTFVIGNEIKSTPAVAKFSSTGVVNDP